MDHSVSESGTERFLIPNTHFHAVQLWKVVMSPLKQNFQDTVDRLKRHAKVVDDTAVAIELVRASQFRIGMNRSPWARTVTVWLTLSRGGKTQMPDMA